MLKIDSHQHYWRYHPVKDAWITGDMAAIQDDFLPADVWPLMQRHGISGSVAVQADQSLAENDFLLDLARQNDFIKGVVGWIDLKAENIDDQLARYSINPLVKGFRHILQGEADDQFMLRPDFMRGVRLLSLYNFTYDILVAPKHLTYVTEFVAAFPNQRFLVDHLAKPYIKAKQIDGWRQDMEALAQFPNVHCKVSGMVTEADWGDWKPSDFEPYLDVVFNAFGASRLMYGSDWPVCNLAGGYDGAVSAIKWYVDKLTNNEQALFWGQNAIDFYRL
ncbi:amidohydrolase family protein [Mucilaginibacter pallidiroseus]|uniref:Amidohydrolase family protein n=1 Tax=Mucilaginibacter pallidiroseus TaxID=2599295 RepID=A0A563U594_9SPHI|nr:amidohydrolase family protein [Mucilaginibacter pallidiroseus]TWR26526.1 amidohydrolase family protein [Mucilaginibacter pallidiroseus]